jgi:aryl-alcohol dehydrogenase-like predicted oxidoreductase
MKRRDFIRNLGFGAAAVAGGTVGACSRETPTTKTQRIKVYNEIGKTGLKMSDISMGCGGEATPYVIDHAITAGLNYFDTAPDYSNGQSEITLGKVFKDKAKRDRCIITTKICARGEYGLHLAVNTPEAKVIEAVEGSLQRLNTDHIDFLQVHAIGERENDLPRLTDPQMLAAVQKLKEQGKVRFLSVTSHGPHCMEDCLLAAVESGLFAMIMPAFNFMRAKRLNEVLRQAEEKGVGVVAMKTLAGAKEEDLSRFKADGSDLAQAAFKWVFTHAAVSGLVITMNTVDEVDKYLAASGKRFTPKDQGILDRYSNEVWAS